MAASVTSRLLRSTSFIVHSRHRFISCSSAATTGLLVRTFGLFYSTGVTESTDDRGLVGKEGAVKVIPEPSGAFYDRFANVEMKKGDWICSQCSFMNFARNLRCLKCKSTPVKDVPGTGEIRSGDWNCPQCNFMNYARNIRCLQCKSDRPQDYLLKKGDWTCPKCSFLNFARNAKCLECNTEKSTFDNLIVRQGDWNCPKCQFMNFARNTSCRDCQEPQAPKQIKLGEWECPSCKFLNFRRNTSCLKCKYNRPKEEVPQSVEDNWRRVRLAMEKSLKTVSKDPPNSGDELSDPQSVDGLFDNGNVQPKKDYHQSHDNFSDDDILQHSKLDQEFKDKVSSA